MIKITWKWSESKTKVKNRVTEDECRRGRYRPKKTTFIRSRLKISRIPCTREMYLDSSCRCSSCTNSLELSRPTQQHTSHSTSTQDSLLTTTSNIFIDNTWLLASYQNHHWQWWNFHQKTKNNDKYNNDLWLLLPHCNNCFWFSCNWPTFPDKGETLWTAGADFNHLDAVPNDNQHRRSIEVTTITTQ